ncbi:Sec-independent protein translocase protein TatA [Galdieria sulphuraria]|uniref:Sec-independent protein translocase protein TatA n=1 Tax=Galdieria sulphuraria TaxID=130081 RepID=M2VYK6_GALSU|nr:sec-independent protein translocase protein TatA [Galdieria sulphuraria]EME28366.1 sec-independent protein translocase protein TatA [Galdieria sulphuraria]GJD12548.1 Sec-independent protein translocase protein TatA [Galdieria sulphuraria]|eukprot:XP_005704886.1 sec-independent protein translocase protein TatA [Galdieria sulphuraria]
MFVDPISIPQRSTRLCRCLASSPNRKYFILYHGVNKNLLFPNYILERKRRKHSSAIFSTSMGLFGLGWPEIAVVVVVGTLIFGPKKISELGKDLGKVVGSMKQATSEFAEGMEESLKETEERRKGQKASSESDEQNKVQSINPSLKEQVYDVHCEKSDSEKETKYY